MEEEFVYRKYPKHALGKTLQRILTALIFYDVIVCLAVKHSYGFESLDLLVVFLAFGFLKSITIPNLICHRVLLFLLAVAWALFALNYVEIFSPRIYSHIEFQAKSLGLSALLAHWLFISFILIRSCCIKTPEEQKAQEERLKKAQEAKANANLSCVYPQLV